MEGLKPVASGRSRVILAALVLCALITLCAALLIHNAEAAGNTLYISPTGSDSGGNNNCRTQSSPCLTFDQALQKATSGDLVMVAAGNYGNQSLGYNDSLSSPVTFQAVRDGNGNAANISSSITANGTSHVIMDGRNADGSYGDHWKITGLAIWARNNHTPTDWTVYGMHYGQTAEDGNAAYIEGPSNHIALIGGEVGPDLGDGIQIWTRASDNAGTSDVTIQGMYCHDGDGTPGGHPDCIQVQSKDWHGNNRTFIRGNYFKHNDNSNIQCDSTSDNIIVENNIFEDTYAGDAGASAYTAVRCNSPGIQYLYNTFVGGQQIQVNPGNQIPVVIGNLGNGYQNGCIAGGIFTNNVWSNDGDVCGAGDQKVSDIGINPDGTLKSTSPARGAGSTALFPLNDYAGASRTSPPDAGALKYGSLFTASPNFYTVDTLNRPISSVNPVISGTAQNGQTLTATAGTWSGSPTSYRYQWQYCDGDWIHCYNIGGATGSSYTVTSGMVGKYLSVQVQAKNNDGYMSAASDYTSAVTASNGTAPTNTTTPTVSGTKNVGRQLSATQGTWGNSPTAYAYQWQRCDAQGTAGSCVNISGATSSTYTLVGADSGVQLRVTVTASNAGGSLTSASAASGRIYQQGDINQDTAVNGADISLLLNNFGLGVGQAQQPLSDVNNDGVINGADLSVTIGKFGT